MKFLVFLFFIQFQINLAAQAADYYPERNNWVEKSPNDFGFNEEKLNQAIDSIISNEYSGAVDLRQAILKGFQREPYHSCLLYTSPSPRDRG